VTTQTVATGTFPVFGSTATLLVTDSSALAAARSIADTELAAVDLACSRFRSDSELSILNAAHGSVKTVSELFAELIDAALRAARLTDGAVDPTCGHAMAAIGYDRDFAQVRAGGAAVTTAAAVPGWRSVRLDRSRRLVRLGDGASLDLGATAKAWAADRCAKVIAEQTGAGVLVSLGGDMAVAGEPPDDGWRVWVTDDHAAGPESQGQTVTIRSGGLATSSTTVRSWSADGPGGPRRMHHIIDPATGQPAASCWRTVSVAAGSCVDANAASTAAIVRGWAALPWLQECGLPARLVTQDGSVRTVAGWPEPDPP
jgi:FAD:protein FMN transferase